MISQTPVPDTTARPRPVPSPAPSIDAPAIDSESAALFRAWACPLLARAESWAGLAASFEARGYGLAIRDGRLVLIRRAGGECLCSLRFLGSSLRELAARLGRPMVRPLPGGGSSGELLTMPSSEPPSGSSH
jgi:hypothetical protein